MSGGESLAPAPIHRLLICRKRNRQPIHHQVYLLRGTPTRNTQDMISRWSSQFKQNIDIFGLKSGNIRPRSWKQRAQSWHPPSGMAVYFMPCVWSFGNNTLSGPNVPTIRLNLLFWPSGDIFWSPQVDTDFYKNLWVQSKNQRCQMTRILFGYWGSGLGRR